MKQISIIAVALALAVASSTAMAKTPKRHSSKPSNSSGVFRQLPNPSYEQRLRQYEEDKRNGWYKEDKA